MKPFLLILLLLPFLVVFAQKKKRLQSDDGSVLSSYDLSAKNPQRFNLPRRIGEASGLAMTDDGRLFSHDDERAVVYQLDFTNGSIIKQFSLGSVGLTGDFEGIAIRGKLFYLVESNGMLYEFAEPSNNGRSAFKTYATFLTTKNDVEGLEYDAETDCLLLACKGAPGKGFSGSKAVYSFSLKKKLLNPTPRFLIPLDQVTARSDNKEFSPSGIAKHPKSGTFFIIAAHGSSIIELSKDGRILAQQSINKKINPHPEGITFSPDYTLILCNDGQGGSASLTLYPPPK